ncbi:MAG TPA: alpha/beta family hydrolase [Marinobacter sp.]|uniref:alpha/beta family hydrolase n=1 Tax=Marinobacter sp. TaxID=50741 RepID=UPI0026284832|nr:alpha/beta family hydrolase [Marinobacter sp.]HET8800200.1 alpha/beta family hydrolase [Marinobacter sp.]
MALIYTKGYDKEPDAVLVLAHGAGAPADSDFMESLANTLDGLGVACVRFEFPYMRKRRQDGRKRPPDRQPVLVSRFSEVLDEIRDVVREDLGERCPVLVGGKSMGGRMASILASERSGMDAVVCFGYPFHPPGKPDRWRTGHFPDIRCPMLIVQGTRDPFGKPGEVQARRSELALAHVHWLDGGNHDFQPLARQKQSQASLIAEAARQTRAFIDALR